MTEQTTDLDPVTAFRAALPPEIRDQLHDNHAVRDAVTTALNHGWTIDQLATEATRDLATAISFGGLTLDRIRSCSTRTPPANVTRAGLPKLPLCGQCDAGWLLNPVTLLPDTRCPCRKATT